MPTSRARSGSRLVVSVSTAVSGAALIFSSHDVELLIGEDGFVIA